MKPIITIDQAVYDKIMYWIQKCDFEISGMGSVVIEDNEIRVVDACLIKQENTGTSTDIDAKALGKAEFELRHAEGELKWWWHSHVNMGVFWSGTDMETIEELSEHGWFAATVFNKKEESRSAVALVDPVHTFVDELELVLTRPGLDDDTMAVLDEEYDKHVSIKEAVFSRASSMGYGGPRNSEWYKQYYGHTDALDKHEPVIYDITKLSDSEIDELLQTDDSDYDGLEQEAAEVQRSLQNDTKRKLMEAYKNGEIG